LKEEIVFSELLDAGHFICIHTPPGGMARGGEEEEGKLIYQPNENIPTDIKTSYSHIKGEE